MELKFPKIKIETSSDFQTKSFSIGDEQVIINILRSKMYSDPIYIICQEIMSNSRDAHREIGTPDTPVEVILPTRFNETIQFKDFGIGITPDRMANIFVCYGRSTKRVDNVQTGGFGLGGKTPFSYTDTFNVITITQDGDKRHKREYIAYIDETQIGAMSLLKTTETDAHTGTTIAIPIKKDDFKRFEQDVLRVSRFWKVRPNIKNGIKTWKEDEIEFQGSDWYMAKSNYSSYGYRYSSGGKPIVIIDGIQYPLKTDTIAGKLTGAASKLVKRDIRLFFNTGDLKITANREDLDYQPEIIKIIADKIDSCVEELRDECSKSVVGATSLIDAIKAWSKSKETYQHLMVRPKWKGLELVESYTTPSYFSKKDVDIYLYKRDGVAADGTIKFKAHRRTRYKGITIKASHNWCLFEHDDDGDRPHIRKIRTLFIDNPTVGYVAGVKFITDTGRVQLETEFNWKHLDIVKLSSTIKAKIIREKGPGRSALVNIKRLTTRRGYRVGTIYKWDGAVNMTASDSGVFVTLYSGDQYRDVNKKTRIEKYILYKLAAVLGVPVYGVLSRAAKKLGPQWIPLEDKCEAVIKQLEADTDVQNYLSRGERYSLKTYASILWKNLLNNQSSILDKSGVLWQYIEESKKSAAGRDKVNKLHSIQTHLRKDNTLVKSATMKKLQEQFIELYPLAHAVSDGYERKVDRELVVKEIIVYANVKDAKKKDGNV